MCRELQTAVPPVASVMRGDTGMMEEVGMLEEKASESRAVEIHLV